MPEREKASETMEKGLRKHRMSSSDCREERGSAPVHKSREREGSEHKRWTEEQRAAGPRDLLDQREARLQGMRTSQHFNTSSTYLIQHLIITLNLTLSS